MLLTIIIVSYNTKALTLQTIDSVFASLSRSPKLEKDSDVWVVDNDSSDGSQAAVTQLLKAHPALHLIKNKENLGFAGANNIAIQRSQGKCVLLLNSDTIVRSDALAQMVETFEQRPIHEESAVLQRTTGEIDRLGILASQLLNPDNTVQAQGGSFPTLKSLTGHMLMLDDLPLIGKFFPSTQHTGQNDRHRQAKSLFSLDWVGGTAMMIRRAVFDEVGVLDDSIFMYGEDIEFCMRAQHHHWDVAVLPSAKITHFGSASSSSKNAIIGELKSYIYIWAKHKPLWQDGIARALIRLGIYLRIFLFGTIIKDKRRSGIYKEAAQTLRTL